MSNAPIPAAPQSNAQLEEILALALAVPAKGDPSHDAATVTWGVPVMLWGPPGIGKTQRGQNVAEALKLAFGYVHPSTKQPEDFGGIPVSDGKGGLKLETVLTAARELAGKRGLLMIDEATTSGRAVMHALLAVTLERLVGDTQLGGGCRVILCGNSAVDAGGLEFTAPLANRLCHIDAPVPTGDEWAQWLVAGDQGMTLDLKDAEAKVADGWGEAWAKSRALFAAFARKRPDLLHKVPGEGDPNRSRAFPTPRSMEQACRVFATAMILGTNLEVRDAVITGCIGAGTATELLTYVADVDLPEPRDVIEGKVEGFFPKRVDRTHAVVDAVTAVVAAAKKPANTTLALGAWKYFERVIDGGQADLIPPAVNVLSRAGLAFGKQLDPVATPVLQKLHRSGVQA